MKLAIEILKREIAQRVLAQKHKHLRKEEVQLELEPLNKAVKKLTIPDVSGSASSEPNLIDQPQMWVDWYVIVYGGTEQEAKKAWGRKMYLLGY